MFRFLSFLPAFLLSLNLGFAASVAPVSVDESVWEAYTRHIVQDEAALSKAEPEAETEDTRGLDSWDNLLRSPKFPSFEPKSYEALRQELGQAYANNQDPYAAEYATKDPLPRFPVLKYKDDRYIMVDNFRVSSLGGRKGEKDANGEVLKTHQVDIRFTSALIDITKLKKASMVMTTFNTKVGPIKFQTGHCQMLFEFENGGVITPEGEVNTLVDSYEAFRDKGTIFNPLLGMFDKYESIFVLGSWSDVILKALKIFNGVDVYDLELNSDEMQKLLVGTLALATNRELLSTVKYHTTRNSCVTNQVRLLNSALPIDRRIQEWHSLFGWKFMRTFSSILPSKVPNTLKKLGLSKKESHFIGKDNILKLYDAALLPHKKTQIFEELYSE